MGILNTTVSAERVVVADENKRKIIEWLENRQNKSKDEILALECGKKYTDNNFLLKSAIFYTVFLLILIFGCVFFVVSYEDYLANIMFLFVIVLITSILVVLKINNNYEKDFKKIIERISKFSALYIDKRKGDGVGLFDVDFADKFITYANNNPEKFEEKWKEVKPISKKEKIKGCLISLVILSVVFGGPLFIKYVCYPSYLKFRYPEELKYSEYKVVDTVVKDKGRYIVKIKYEIDGKEYVSEIYVEGYAWRYSGKIYYNPKNPDKVIYYNKNN